MMPTRILVPTDFSVHSDRALEQALDTAKKYHAKIFLLHVIQEDIYRPIAVTASDFGLSKKLWQQVIDRQRVEIENKLQNQLDKFPQAKEVDVVTNVCQGVPCQAILKEAKEKKIDLIVIASLGKTGIAKYFMGSVARNVVNGSKCPALVIK
jgi:nucleotide-binding universal stress UspA family protein